ncbi:ATP-dependent Clp protease proteolytic subunit [Streptomyces sp. SA15]|uniref:ClpP family protease n=1 Tax=Streptomyces sp. SA15 TaxID=934019 RepID=UPI000BAE8AAF|nr:ATP-dependent Clp protease proteolytic subunit [Streptomyces sp. SA15]PAZ15303.1 ATP-dependent Clp protease proteolytic subunit [Streptomyces sp. SA15]
MSPQEPSKRIITLDQEVNDDVANRVTAQLLRLADADPEADILLCVDSPGGSVTAGMAIYDTMQFVSCDVATCVTDLAAGVGQLLLSAGAQGKRYAMLGARIVMTRPREEGEGARDGDPLARLLRRLGKPAGSPAIRHTQKVVSELLARHTGGDRSRILRDLNSDREFGAEEARIYGLVDTVVQRGPGQ